MPIREVKKTVHMNQKDLNKHTDRWKGVGNALLAAVLFGVSTPLAKSISPCSDPILMAGLLYLGSGIGLGVYVWLRFQRKNIRLKETALTCHDIPWLAGAISQCEGQGIAQAMIL